MDLLVVLLTWSKQCRTLYCLYVTSHPQMLMRGRFYKEPWVNAIKWAATILYCSYVSRPLEVLGKFCSSFPLLDDLFWDVYLHLQWWILNKALSKEFQFKARELCTTMKLLTVKLWTYENILITQSIKSEALIHSQRTIYLWRTQVFVLLMWST